MGILNIFRSHSVSIITGTWQFIRESVKIKHIPRKGELIYLEEEKSYFKVLNVVYNITKKQGIFIVVEKMEQDPKEDSKGLTS